MNISNLRRTLAGGLTLALVATAPLASADQTVVVEGDRGHGGPNPYLLGTGIATLGVAYAPAIAVAVNSDLPADNHLYAPVVGPWMDLATRDCDDGCGNESVNKTLLVVDGVFQAIGALQIVASLLYIGSDTPATVAADDTSTTIAPARLSSEGYGLVAVGRF